MPASASTSAAPYRSSTEWDQWDAEQLQLHRQQGAIVAGNEVLLVQVLAIQFSRGKTPNWRQETSNLLHETKALSSGTTRIRTNHLTVATQF